MRFWTENVGLEGLTEQQLRGALDSEKVSDGWIAQLEKTEKDYLHTMAFIKPSGEVGFYLERRGPNPNQWYRGVTPDRPKYILPRHWWQFWAKDIEIHLFGREEMIDVFCQFLDGESQPDQAKWEEIPPSYRD